MNRKRILFALLATVLLGGSYMQFGGQPDALPSGSEAAARLATGPLAVQSETIELVDTSRPMRAHDDFAGRHERPLNGRIWHAEKASGKRQPLFIYNHGFLSNHEGGTHLTTFLASHGYVAAAIDFPMTSMFAEGGPWVRDVAQQPADVRFLIDYLLQRNDTPGDTLYEAIDPERIAVGGLSLGGMTTSLVSFHPRMFDPRIKAGLSFAGPGSMFARPFYAHRDIPFLMMASKIDAMVQYEGNASTLPQLANEPTLVTLEDGSHAGFAWNSRGLRFLENPDSAGCFMLMHVLGDVNAGENWISELGTEADGIVLPEGHEPCTADTLPPAMNLLRQQDIQILVAWSFLQSVFAAEPEDRARAEHYLYTQLATEFPSVSVAGLAPSQRTLITAEATEPQNQVITSGIH